MMIMTSLSDVKQQHHRQRCTSDCVALHCCTTKSLAIAEIARVDNHYAVQAHLRSLILVPIKSQYATSYTSE